MLYIQIYFTVFVFATVVGLTTEQNILPKIKTFSFNIHQGEEKQFLKDMFQNAIDVQLIHLGDLDHKKENVCQIEQRGVDVETQELQLINDKELNSEEFDPIMPLSFRSFVGMVHINDGLIAVDSSMTIYMLKFDYDELHAFNKNITLNEENEKRQSKFTSLHWQADLSSVLKDNDSKSEIPQLVYSQEQNYAYLVYTTTIQIFSVKEMENNNDTLGIGSTTEWRKRMERGWSKTKGQLFYSAAGAEGIDIYQIDNGQLTFKLNIEIIDKVKLMVEDYEIIQCHNTDESILCHHLILLDQNYGIMVVQVLMKKGQQLTYQLLMRDIGIQRGGIALDTIDGTTVIAAYLQGHRYVTQEVHIDLQSQKWRIIAEYTQRTKLVDIKMNKDIAVLQGINHHQVIFHGIDAIKKTFSMVNPIYISHGRMRDFDFFNAQQMLDSSIVDRFKDLNYQFDDFMFGVTKHKLFITRYKITSPFVRCFASSTKFQTFLYTAIYNKTLGCESTPLCQDKINFSVEVVSTFVYEGNKIVLVMVGGFISFIFIILIIFLIVLYRRFLKDSYKLRMELANQKIGNTAGNESSNQIQMNQSISIVQQLQK